MRDHGPSAARNGVDRRPVPRCSRDRAQRAQCHSRSHHRLAPCLCTPSSSKGCSRTSCRTSSPVTWHRRRWLRPWSFLSRPCSAGSPELVRKLAGPGRELAADERAYCSHALSAGAPRRTGEDDRRPPSGFTVDACERGHRSCAQVGVDGRAGASRTGLDRRRPGRPCHEGRSARRGLTRGAEAASSIGGRSTSPGVDSKAWSRPRRIPARAGGQALLPSSEAWPTCFAAG